MVLRKAKYLLAMFPDTHRQANIGLTLLLKVNLLTQDFLFKFLVFFSLKISDTLECVSTLPNPYYRGREMGGGGREETKILNK